MAKKVLITGGAKGLGRATALEFAKHGYEVVITYLNSEVEAKELCSLIKDEYKVEADAYKVDLEEEEEINALIDEVGGLDVLVNNAAYNLDEGLFSKTALTFQKILQVNLVAPFLLSKGFYISLKSRKGSIVNIASTNGIDTMYEESIDYDASKAGLINLTKSLASVFGPDIRVNAIAPGWIDTENCKDMNPDFRTQAEERIVAGRFASPGEIAKTVYFVASEDASYMTGSIIRVDGGEKYGNR